MAAKPSKPAASKPASKTPAPAPPPAPKPAPSGARPRPGRYTVDGSDLIVRRPSKG